MNYINKTYVFSKSWDFPVSPPGVKFENVNSCFIKLKEQ